MDRNNVGADRVRNHSRNPRSLETIAQALWLANIARHGPIQGEISRTGDKRYVVFPNKNETNWLIRNGFAHLHVGEGKLTISQLGLKALDNLCFDLWPETSALMEGAAAMHDLARRKALKEDNLHITRMVDGVMRNYNVSPKPIYATHYGDGFIRAKINRI